jgi:peptidoglycan/xylan/chitin deacetylase (PgdA/CDA1 family)
MLITRIARALRSRLRPRPPQPIVLMYHRVASLRWDPWGLAVEPRHFEAQMAYIREHRTPLPMDELIHQLAANTLPANAVAVTFDDGYRDNLINAKPILVAYGIPATVFVATGYVDRESPFWWDELAAMILEADRPARHVVDCSGETIALEWGPPDHQDLAASWRVGDGAQTDRQRCYIALWTKLKRATVEEREGAMVSLRARFEARVDPLSMPVSRRDVQALVSDELLEIGAHSVNHSMLTSCTAAEGLREIEQSARACRSLSGHAARGFAYPYGDLNADARNSVRLAGFAWACSTEGTFLDGESTDPYAVPRIAAPNVPPRRFNALACG